MFNKNSWYHQVPKKRVIKILLRAFYGNYIDKWLHHGQYAKLTKFKQISFFKKLKEVNNKTCLWARSEALRTLGENICTINCSSVVLFKSPKYRFGIGHQKNMELVKTSKPINSLF